MSAAFPPDVRQFVDQEAATGRYRSESDLVIEAVRRLRDDEENLRRFKAQLQDRIGQLDRGEGIVLSGDEELSALFDEIEAEVDAQRVAAKRATS